MDEQQVREAIDGLIEQQEKRISQLQGTSEDVDSLSDLHHAIDVLIHLKHVLRLCGCPDEVYEQRGEA